MRLGKPAVEARRVGNSLVATFNRSRPPLIWRFDLERHHSFTVSLQGEAGDWELGMTSLKGEFYPIVSFTAREDADEAFACIGKILARGGRRNWFMAILKLIAAIVLLLVILIGGTMLFIGHELRSGALTGASMALRAAPSTSMPLSPGSPTGADVPADAGDTATGAKAGEAKAGVPLSADDVLRPPP